MYSDQVNIFDKLLVIAYNDLDLVQEAIWKSNPGPIYKRKWYGKKVLVEQPSPLSEVIDYILKNRKPL